MRDKAKGLIACSEMLEHFLSVRWHIDDTRSHCFPVAQLWIGSSLNW